MSDSSRRLVVNVVSAKGLQYEVTDRSVKIQLNLLFKGNLSKSSEVDLRPGGDTVFSFQQHIHISGVDYTLEDNDSAIFICVTAKELTPVGFTYSRSLKAIAVVDYRLAYLHPDTLLSVELIPCEFEGLDAAMIGPGTLFIRLCIEDDKSDDYRTEAVIEKMNETVSKYQSRLSQKSLDNYQLARHWWAQLRTQYPWMEGKDLKMLAEDECGQQRLVSSFVAPIASPREIESPTAAARFVSLIPFSRHASLAGGRVSKWKSPLALLSTLQGDVEDHAVLLCCFLLGWGMNAWVARGTIQTNSGPSEGATIRTAKTTGHCWVVTLDAIVDGRVVFWEALTGQQYTIPIDQQSAGAFVDLQKMSSTSIHPFLEIHSLFRHGKFLLNVQRQTHLQPSEAAVRKQSSQSFDVHNAAFWAAFAVQEDDLLRHPGSRITIESASRFPPACVNDFVRHVFPSPSAVADKLEGALKEMIIDMRSDLGLKTRFDDTLSRVLDMALLSYELERSLGATVPTSNADFQCAIKALVDRGESFKAYPICFSHCDFASIAISLKRKLIVREIISAVSNSASALNPPLLSNPTSSSIKTNTSSSATQASTAARHGLRVHVRVYPEGLCCVWIILAVCYNFTPRGNE